MNGGPSLPSPGSLIHLAVEVITWQGGAGNVLPPGTPALVVEVTPAGPAAAANLARELRALALRHPHTASIRRFLFHPRFPVDVRHNAKIHRLTLARWAVRAKVQVAPEGNA